VAGLDAAGPGCSSAVATAASRRDGNAAALAGEGGAATGTADSAWRRGER
jgi:hypothetical protein